MMNRSVLSGMLGGVVLGMLLVITSRQPFIEADILLPSIAFGSIIVAIVILYRNDSFKHAILRTILMFMSCFIAIRLFAITGIVEFFDNTLYIQESDANNRAAGMVMICILMFLLGESIIINGIQLARSLIKRSTGDGSKLLKK